MPFKDSSRRLEIPSDDLEVMEEFAAEMGVDEDVDLLLVGDGSGGTHRSPAGWGCMAYDRDLETVTIHAGALTAATVNFAELVPYVHALWHHHQSHADREVVHRRVAIVSDSQVTVRCGNREYRRKANGCLWASIEWFERRGYELEWIHVRRNSNEWSEFADWIADRGQRAAKKLAAAILRELPGD